MSHIPSLTPHSLHHHHRYRIIQTAVVEYPSSPLSFALRLTRFHSSIAVVIIHHHRHLKQLNNFAWRLTLDEEEVALGSGMIMIATPATTAAVVDEDDCCV
eukprot:scaffold28005_cov78-Skeletonema_dohrnii-CCMP3373.AAC.1